MFKRNIMRRRFIEGTYSTYQLAHELRVSTITTYRYQKEFERIKAHYPDQLDNMYFYMPEQPKPHRETPLYKELIPMLPVLAAGMQGKVLKAMPLWEEYRKHCPQGYSYSPFKFIFFDWFEDSVIPYPVPLLDSIAPADQPILQHWRRGNDHRHWQIAVVLQGAITATTLAELMSKAESSWRTVTQWIRAYKTKGLAGLEPTPRKPNVRIQATIKNRKEKLVKLLHESPQSHGLNRTSWSIVALTRIYNQLYQPEVHVMQVSRCLRQLGYRYKQSRDMLTSPDPKFREKIKKIQRILQHLKPNEKFFSIDEYGPVGVKIKGGRTLRHEKESPVAVPEKQRAKGVIICTAALELSTNQVHHFYSEKKNTFEMIKLIDLLLARYADQSRIYLCWDAVSWHNSLILKQYIQDHNATAKPEIRIAPLPASTQFLNVIEAVFGGLAKAVIHNSDYPTLEACKQAIDLHFSIRNAYFLANPKRAGKKIWGQEHIRARFSELQDTRKRSAMHGAR
ncbi:IS630 family transposase [Mucilaginibacter yixingensis]